MKRTLILSTFTLLVAALVFAPTMLDAQPAPKARGFGGPHGPAGDRGELFLERMAEHLELSEAQIGEIEELMEAHRIETAGLREEARLAYEAAREAMERDVFDEVAIRETGRRASDARIELAVERARLRGEINAVLTVEQREKAAELKAERAARWEHFEERRGERWGDRRGRAPGAQRW